MLPDVGLRHHLGNSVFVAGARHGSNRTSGRARAFRSLFRVRRDCYGGLWIEAAANRVIGYLRLYAGALEYLQHFAACRGFRRIGGRSFVRRHCRRFASSIRPKPAATAISPYKKTGLAVADMAQNCLGSSQDYATSAPASRPASPASSAPAAGDVGPRNGYMVQNASSKLRSMA